MEFGTIGPLKSLEGKRRLALSSFNAHARVSFRILQRGSASWFTCEIARAHTRTRTYGCTHTRDACTHTASRGELSGAQASICATNHDHPTRYRDRWRVYSLPTHCAEIKFYPSRWRTRPANCGFYVTRLARQMRQSFLARCVSVNNSFEISLINR